MEQVLKALFILLLCLFPLGQIARVELGGGVNILFNDIAVFALAAFWLLKKIVNKEKFVKVSLTKPILIFSFTALLSLILNSQNFTSQELLVSSLYLVRWIIYASLFFIVSEFPDMFKKKILRGLIIAGSTVVLIGFLQYILYPDLRNLFYVGWDEHLYRLFSSFLDPNFAGAIFVLTFLLSFAKKGTGYIFASILSFVGMLLTYSRGSFLSFLGGSIMFFTLTKRWKILAILFGVFALGIVFLPKNLQSEGVQLLRTASIQQRFESAENAVTIFKDHPLFGVGFNTYRYIQLRYGFITEEQVEQSHAAAGTDNSFLFVLATTGIIGFLAYTYLWFVIIKNARGNYIVVASIVAIFVHSLFVNSLFYPQILEWLWILLASSKAEKSL